MEESSFFKKGSEVCQGFSEELEDWMVCNFYLPLERHLFSVSGAKTSFGNRLP